MTNTDYITASEIGDYVYCKRGWWLKFNKLLPNNSPEMIAGTEGHESLAKEIGNNKKNIKLAWSFIGFGLLIFCLILLFMFFIKI